MVKIRKVVGVVVVRSDGKFIILKRASDKKVHSGLWNTPSGGIEKDESLEEAAKREVYEETGMKISDITIGSKELIYTQEYKIEITYVLAATENDTVQLNEENIDFKWVTPKESLEYKFAVTRDVVERVLKEFKLL